MEEQYYENPVIGKITIPEQQKNLRLLENEFDIYEKSRQETIDVRKNKKDAHGNRVYSEESLKKTLLLMDNMQQDILDKYIVYGGDPEYLINGEYKKQTTSRKKDKGFNRKDLLLKIKQLEETKSKSVQESEDEEPSAPMKANRKKTKTMAAKGPISPEDFVSNLPSKKKTTVNKPVVQEDMEENTEELSFITQKSVDPYARIDTPRASAEVYNEPIRTDQMQQGGTRRYNISELHKHDIDDYDNKKASLHSNIAAAQYSATANKVQFDQIPLPSKGECYPNKLSSIPVAYMTAYDENLIVSPNLYHDGTFLDCLIKSKVLSNEINTDDLLQGDRDAIILWLRATSYGPDFPVSVTDKETGEKFDTTVDLSTLKMKKFKLKGDQNGYFDFTLPVSKDVVKFRFLTYKDSKILSKLAEEEDLKVKKGKMLEISDLINEYAATDTELDRSSLIRLREAAKTLKDYTDTFDDDDVAAWTNSVTNKLAMSIVSINGITDRDYVNDYIMGMNLMDSSKLRKYIADNEPGIDFNVRVKRPGSLGGGSMDMFLSVDQYLFLNIA